VSAEVAGQIVGVLGFHNETIKMMCRNVNAENARRRGFRRGETYRGHST